ncbi:hypothetical protein D9C73_011661 [Collichthys lucidus]|uniref:Uncharacterized protein n=1 Tax=Collichthys lucidus TaxID=240159 RepID=A0A4U5USR2_COLLU|nr:hypothetical protein D9C73_011661 [Collichthys lucidus]
MDRGQGGGGGGGGGRIKEWSECRESEHQQRGEGHNQFHREEEEKAQVDKEESGRKRGRRELPEEKKHHREDCTAHIHTIDQDTAAVERGRVGVNEYACILSVAAMLRRPTAGCGSADSPCGGSHVSLHVTRASGSCVLHRCMGHLSPGPRDHSLLLSSSLSAD